MKITVPTIDFGTCKIVTMVAQSNGERCDIVGSGAVPYDGYAQDGWNDPEKVGDAIRTAIDQAQKTGNCRIQELNVGVPGMFSHVILREVRVSLTGPDPHVTAEDVRACFKQAENLDNDKDKDKDEQQLFLQQQKEKPCLIHSAPAWFRVDDGKKTLSPVGIKGRELSAMIALVIADKYFVDDVSARLQSMGIAVREFYSTVAGEATYLLSQDERDKTAMLIDIGYLCTDVMVMEGDALIFHKCLDIGGGHISADVAEQLNIPFPFVEEKIKQSYNFNSTNQDETYVIPATEDKPAVTIRRDQVAPIIEAKVEEIADEINKALEEGGVKLGKWSNVYLTGGGLMLNKGGKDFLAGKLHRIIREAQRTNNKMTSHVFSSAVGLTILAVTTQEEQKTPEGGAKGLFSRAFRWLMGY